MALLVNGVPFLGMSQPISISKCIMTLLLHAHLLILSLFSGSTPLCLTALQASMGSQAGVQCKGDNYDIVRLGKTKIHDDMYDTSCLMAMFQGGDKDACTSTIDEGGQACQYCSLNGMANVCLTESQANLASGYGVTCNGDDVGKEKVDQSSYDTSCIMAFMQNNSKDACTSAVDEVGSPCEYCSLQGAINICLSHAQAEMAEGVGVECNGSSKIKHDIYDGSCLKAFVKGDHSEDSCKHATDEDGNACKWCHTGVADVCLTETQGDMAGQLGMWCDGEDLQLKEDAIATE
jgi:hypothetical protein